MKIFTLVITLILALIGFVILFSALRDSREIYFGKVTSKISGMKNALLTGLSSGMLFLVLMIIVSLSDKKFEWTLKSLSASLVFSVIVGFIIFVGTYASFSIVSGFRNSIYRKTNDETKK